MQEEAFSELPLSAEGDALKGTQLSLFPSPGVSSAKEDRVLSQERKLKVETTARQTLSQWYFPSFPLRAQSSFLEIIYTPVKSLHPPSPFSIKVAFNPEF